MEVQAVLPMELGLPVTEKTMSLEHSLMWLPRARTLSGLLRQRIAQGKARAGNATTATGYLAIRSASHAT